MPEQFASIGEAIASAMAHNIRLAADLTAAQHLAEQPAPDGPVSTDGTNICPTCHVTGVWPGAPLHSWTCPDRPTSPPPEVRGEDSDHEFRDALLVLLSRAARGVLTPDEGPLLRQHVEHLLRRLDQTTAGRATWKAKGEEMERDRDRWQQRARKADRATNLLADSHRRAERAEAALARVRDRCQAVGDRVGPTGMINAAQILGLLSPTWPDDNYEAPAALDGPAAGQADNSRHTPAPDAHPDTERQASGTDRAGVTHPAEAERDQAYTERAALLAWLAALHPGSAVIAPASDTAEPNWQLLYLLAGGRQMSWHIAPRDAELFEHVEHVQPDDPRAQWDGHTTAVKYQGIQEHICHLAADA